MIPVCRLPLVGLGWLLAGTIAASAADRSGFNETAPLTPAQRLQMVFEIGLGVELSPAYPGAKAYEVLPVPVGSLDYLLLPGFLEIGEPDARRGGFRVGPSLGYRGKRDSGDHPELTGLNVVGATYEAGVKVTYEWPAAEAYAALRYAFGGADGLVGDIGANAVWRPIETLELKAGPRATFASDGYMDAYFRVSAAEAAASAGRFSVYHPDGGIMSVGVRTTARYEFRPDWFLIANASYDRLIGEAGDSPIVAVGSADQFSVGLALSRRFRIGF